MSTSYDKYDVATDVGSDPYGDRWFGQTFTASKSYTATSIKLLIYQGVGGDPGTITFSIRATSGNLPTGNDLTSGSTTDAITEDIAGEWKEITLLNPYPLHAGVVYAIVVRCTGAGGVDKITWLAKNVGGYGGGIGCHSLTDAGVTWTVGTGYDHMFDVWGIPFAGKNYSKRHIAIGNDEFWYEYPQGTMVELSAANGDIDTGEQLEGSIAFQKLFIANYDNLKVADFVNVKLVTSTLSATNYPNQGNILTGSGSGATMVVDYCSSLTGTANLYGKLTSTAAFVSTDTVANSALSISFTLTAGQGTGPHWYDWTIYGNSTTFGVMPTKATLVSRYRGRLVLSGDSDYPHMWWMSKVANPWNFYYDSTKPLSAVNGTNIDAGEIGDIVTALIPYGDDFLLFGCASSIHLLNGDPGPGMAGSIDEITEETGIFGSKAWCKDNEGNLWFWGTNGLYKMFQGQTKPTNISSGLLSTLVEDWAVDPALHRIVLSFDPIRNGIIISKAASADGTNENYWYDIRAEGFYPITLPEECAIFSSVHYDSDDPDTRKLLFGCNDGYIRAMDNSEKNDDIGATEEAINAYVGWVEKLGDGENQEGKLTSLAVELAGGASGGAYGDTDSVNIALYVAADAETCMEDMKDTATSAISVTLSGTGRKYRIREKLRGGYLGIKFFSAISDVTWSLNKVTGDVKPVGRFKE